MAQTFFQFINEGEFEIEGGLTATPDGSIATGRVLQRDGDGTVDLCTATKIPAGFALVNRTLTYSPTSLYAATGEYVALAKGHIDALVSADYFVGTTLPTFGAQLYAAAGGLMDTSGQTAHWIGQVVQTDAIRSAPNTTQNVVRIVAHFNR